jgi:hypothetical protein
MFLFGTLFGLAMTLWLLAWFVSARRNLFEYATLAAWLLTLASIWLVAYWRSL